MNVEIKKEYNCPKCNNRLSQKSEDVSKGYFAACLECDEDFYNIEINNI
jgi:transcription elongation factor Elf1